jgi:dTDP-glucose 4,6-dehydratase
MGNVEFWVGRPVLVAGATGFLGGWLVKRLIDNGAHVVAIVRSPKPESQFYLEGFDRRVHVERGSIYDTGFVERVFRKHGIEVFFHAAYGADVNRVLTEPLECFRSSTESTWSILDFLRREKPDCISVISSTDKAYGTQELPYRESNPLAPTHPYEVAKASQDLAAQSYGKTYGLPIAVTRCGNYFGAFDFNFTRLIPGVVRDVMEGRRPVLRSDGRFTRDFLYIEDAVDVQLLLAERLAVDRSIYGEAFNFSYGEQLEVIDIVRRIAELMGKPVEPVVNNTVQAEIRHMHLSSNKAIQFLNWQPGCGFDEGLRRTLKWYADYYQPKTHHGLHTGLLGSLCLSSGDTLLAAAGWL